ncbi:hypothetical protein ACFP56_07425 [Paenibacillus septentrionalis]|uniref:Uncharacterized protein n=1 Tax=Paenibacillus septentrionalis TaxID=429342 RepID=A0ABW1V133_9BACL
MGIIDLIFDNIYFVVIFLFVVFKLIGSFSGNKKPTGTPTFGGDEPQKRWFDEEEETYDRPVAQSSREEDRAREVYSPSPQVGNDRVFQPAQNIVPAAPTYEERMQELRTRQERTKQRLLAAQKVERSAQASQLGAKDLQEAVIWSEILGQPRAKRPHSQFSKRNQ